MLHVFHDCLLTDSFFDATLRLDIERVSIKSRNLALPTKLCLLRAVTLLSQELCETCGVGLGSGSYFW
jgi:hypothetical protein